MNRNIGMRNVTSLLGLALVTVFVGCEPQEPNEKDEMSIVGGDHQCGIPRKFLDHPLEARVLGPRGADFLGRPRERQPQVNVPVHFRIDDLKKRRYLDLLSTARNEDPTDAPNHDVPADKPVLQEESEELNTTGANVARLHPVLYPYRPNRDSDDGEAGSIELTAYTDQRGVARVDVKLGDVNGAWRVEAEHGEEKGEKVHFHLVNGVEINLLDGDEGRPGAKLGIELALKKWDAETQEVRPLPDREVAYRLVDEPGGAAGTADLKDRSNTTDSDGLRETEITLGEKTGVYRVLAEILPDRGDPWPWRGVLVSVVATDWVGVGFQFSAGVLLFIIGVRLLGRGCLLLTSSQMHLPIGPWTRNRFSGFFGGIVAGSMFQSASLVTSYLTSLSNSGLLRARGALGIILGANIGGTVLCQILALDIELAAAPVLVIGALLFLSRRSTQLGSWAWVFVGSGLILFSWSVLDESVSAAALNDTLRRTAGLLYSQTLAGFLTCFLLAAASAFLLRTSNLVVVVTMLVVLHGIVAPDATIPLVLGANLGAPIMVFALTSRKRHEPKRVALLNLLFQFFGCAIAFGLWLVVIDGSSIFLWLIEDLVPGTLLSPLPANVPLHVATAHTVYNLLAALSFLFVPTALLRPLDRLMPESTVDAVKPIHLDENLKNVPALALRQTTAEVVYMTEICRKAVAEAFDSFRYSDLSLSDQVVRREQVLSDMHREVSRYLVEVCENQLARRDATQLEILQSAAESVARIGASAEGLRELTTRKIDEKLTTPEEIERDLGEVYDLVLAQFGNILTLLDERDVRTEENAVKMVERLAKYSSRIHAHWRQGRDEGAHEPLPVSLHQQLIIYQEAFSLLFSIAADLAHIAQRMRILAPQR